MLRFNRVDHTQGEDDDPLAKVIAPPLNESPHERECRLARELEAQRRSDAIDEELERERKANERAPKCIRILLLGQSESGKSTTLKNFQLLHSPKAFRTERASWRAVVQLNVARSIRMILDAMSDAQASRPLGTPRPVTPSAASDYPVLSPDLLRLKMRLLPLQQVEANLLRRLSPPGSVEFEATHLSPVTNLPYSGRAVRSNKEIAVNLNSRSQWKSAFSRLLSSSSSSSTARSSFESGADVDFDDPNDPGVVLHACAQDMIKLWNDPTIKQLLSARKQRLEDMGGFFLDSLERITSPRYIPTDEDILRARLKTVGASEHRFKLKAGNMLSHDWRVYDVGGARSLRAAWAPYFDNMDAIIFLAPISCFDQVLEEDPSVNRLEDSILLWKSIVSNQLLKNTQIVLFLNKIDIMKAKLRAGIKFGHYVISYAKRPNDFESTSTYIKKKFGTLHKQYSPLPRVFYCHLTVMTDPKSTQQILENVKDMVVRENLEKSSLV